LNHKSPETTSPLFKSLAEAQRLVVDDLGFEDDGISHLTARFGFQEPTDVPRLLQLASENGIEGDVDPDSAVYFLSQISIVPADHPGLQRWRKQLYVALTRNASSPVDYFKLPRERTISVGTQIEL
jgi:KUP system potassium uptake protein